MQAPSVVLHHGVVVRIAAPADGSEQPCSAQALAVLLGRVLRLASRVMDASWRRALQRDRGVEGRQRQPSIDPRTDGVSYDLVRTSVHDDGEIDEADRHRDVGQARDRELVWTVDDELPRPIREDRLVVIGVGGRDLTPPRPCIQTTLTHQALHLLVITIQPCWARVACIPRQP